MQININIIDEDRSVVEMMAELFEQHGFGYRTFPSAEDFLPALNEPNPSISFVSFVLPREGVRQVLDRLRYGNVASSVVLTGVDLATSQIVEAIKAGVEDILEKPFTSDQLLANVKRIVSSPAYGIQTRQIRSSEIGGHLTIEEHQMLSLMEQGATIKEIALKLDISVRSVHYRKASILEKTNCKNCTEVVSKIAAMHSARVVPMNNQTADLLWRITEMPAGTMGSSGAIGSGGEISGDKDFTSTIG